MKILRSSETFDPEHFEFGQHKILSGVPFEIVTDMKVLGAKVSCDSTQGCELEFKIDNGTRAFYANARQLLCSKASIQVRLSLLYKLVAQ
eukprot:710462-Karenia_brevis.AAC.1